jgi:hypothetical protein
MLLSFRKWQREKQIKLDKYFTGQLREITHGVFNGTLRTGLVLPDLKDVSVSVLF